MSEKKKKRELVEQTCADEGDDDQPFMPIPIPKSVEPPRDKDTDKAKEREKEREKDKEKEREKDREREKEKKDLKQQLETTEKTNEANSPKAPTPPAPSTYIPAVGSPREVVTGAQLIGTGPPPVSPPERELPTPNPPAPPQPAQPPPVFLVREPRREEFPVVPHERKKSTKRRERATNRSGDQTNTTTTNTCDADFGDKQQSPIPFKPIAGVSTAQSNSAKNAPPATFPIAFPVQPKVATRTRHTGPSYNQVRASVPRVVSSQVPNKKQNNSGKIKKLRDGAATPPRIPNNQQAALASKVQEELAIQNSIQVQDDEYWTLVDQTVINRDYFHGYFTMHYITKMLKYPGDYILGILPYNNEKKGWHLASGIGLCVAPRDIRFIPIKGGKRKQYRFRGGKITKPTIQELVAEYACGEGLSQPFENGVDKLVYLNRSVPRVPYILPHKRVQLHDRIGGGNFGVVYDGTLHDRNKKFEVAVKIFKPSTLASNPGANRTKDILHQKKFLEEAYVMWQLKHPNIVHFYGICSLKPALMIIMEYCRGGCARNYLQKHGEGVSMAVKNRLAIEACEGLKYLTNRDFVHRDVAARNCLLDENLSLKVADFGLTTDVEILRRKADNANAMVLPIKWAAPEVLRSGDFSWASDVWAFGVMLFEFYNEAREPYTGLRNRVVREELLKGNSFRMELPTNIPMAIRLLMMRCWAEEPSKRPSFGVLADELRKAQRSTDAT